MYAPFLQFYVFSACRDFTGLCGSKLIELCSSSKVNEPFVDFLWRNHTLVHVSSTGCRPREVGGGIIFYGPVRVDKEGVHVGAVPLF